MGKEREKVTHLESPEHMTHLGQGVTLGSESLVIGGVADSHFLPGGIHEGVGTAHLSKGAGVKGKGSTGVSLHRRFIEQVTSLHIFLCLLKRKITSCCLNKKKQ